MLKHLKLNLFEKFELQNFNITQKTLFNEKLKKINTNVSDYTFVNNYIWLSNADGYFKIINDNMCLFIYENNILSMLLPPFGGNNFSDTLDECFKIMNAINELPCYSKVNYVSEEFLSLIDKNKYEIKSCEPDYIYLKDEILALKGNKFKSKRNDINYFVKNYKNFKYIKYENKFYNLAIDLINRWIAYKLNTLFKIEDNVKEHFFKYVEYEKNAIIRLLDDYNDLDLCGGVIFIDDKIEGITFGEKINNDVALILIEKTNLNFHGISQYLFQKFCLEEFNDCKYINVGDDLGLNNLKKTKQSYHPYAYAKKYVITCK